MGTHYYAVDGTGHIHVFHSQSGRAHWLGEVRHQDRRASPIERRDAEKLLGRAPVRKMTRTRHPFHLQLDRPPASGPDHT